MVEWPKVKTLLGTKIAFQEQGRNRRQSEARSTKTGLETGAGSSSLTVCLSRIWRRSRNNTWDVTLPRTGVVINQGPGRRWPSASTLTNKASPLHRQGAAPFSNRDNIRTDADVKWMPGTPYREAVGALMCIDSPHDAVRPSVCKPSQTFGDIHEPELCRG